MMTSRLRIWFITIVGISWSLSLLALPVLANDAHYSRVRVQYSAQSERTLMSLVDPESIVASGSGVIEIFANQSEIEGLRSVGFRVDVLIDDAASFIRWRNSHYGNVSLKPVTDDLPTRYRPGSFSGFHTLQEIYENFRQMREVYPNLVSAADTIGTSVEGRPLLAYTIAKNPNDTMLATALYNSLHHAREPASASSLIYFFWHLLESYERGDTDATFLLEQRRLFCVPVLNPDGYEFNYRTNPGGGGLWRKNRALIDGVVRGVDLNRNYGPLESWDSPAGGSSEEPWSETYRGPAPFSEPETDAFARYIERVRPHLVFNYHSHGQLLIYPYGYTGSRTSDSLKYMAACEAFARHNSYTCGIGIESVAYPTRGTADDFIHDALQPSRPILTFTPEVGRRLFNFWPPESEIQGQLHEVLRMNYEAAFSAGVNLQIRSVEPVFLPGTDSSTTVAITIVNAGVQVASQAVVSVKIQHESAPGVITAFTIDRLHPGQDTTVLIAVRPFSCQKPAEVVFSIHTPEGVITRRQSQRVGPLCPRRIPLLTSRDVSVPWSSDGWDITTNEETEQWIATSKPTFGGTRIDSISTIHTLTLSTPVSLIDAVTGFLVFDAKWSFTGLFEMGNVRVSTNGGRTWELLKNNEMRQGVGISDNLPGSDEYGFDGYRGRWSRQVLDLSAYLGKEILISFVARYSSVWHDEYFAVRNVAVLATTRASSSGNGAQSSPLSMTVFPNPASSLIYFALDRKGAQIEAGTYTVRLYDALGKLCLVQHRDHLLANEIYGQVDASGLAHGMYTIEVEWQGQRYTRGLVMLSGR